MNEIILWEKAGSGKYGYSSHEAYLLNPAGVALHLNQHLELALGVRDREEIGEIAPASGSGQRKRREKHESCERSW